MNGEPVEGAVVRRKATLGDDDDDRALHQQTTTDAQGRFLLPAQKKFVAMAPLHGGRVIHQRIEIDYEGRTYLGLAYVKRGYEKNKDIWLDYAGPSVPLKITQCDLAQPENRLLGFHSHTATGLCDCENAEFLRYTDSLER